jgi:hypothetical protein
VPPRFAYWTILIDNTATAFRAQHAEDLLPTLVQLRRTNKDVVMKWFARGRLWESPESARAAAQKPKVQEKRGRDWRPGGQHKDPRARFGKRRSDKRTDKDVVQAFRPARKPPAFAPGHGTGRPERFPKSESKGRPPAGKWQRPAKPQHFHRHRSPVGEAAASTPKPQPGQRSGGPIGEPSAQSAKPQHGQRRGSPVGDAATRPAKQHDQRSGNTASETAAPSVKPQSQRSRKP